MAVARWWNRAAGERLIREKPFQIFSRPNATYCSVTGLEKKLERAGVRTSARSLRCRGERRKENQLS